MEWWDNIWLNEGFASFYPYAASENVFPDEDWDTKQLQVYSDIIYSLNRDVTSTSRPIIADVRNPDEITAAFDWVIYQKGSSVIYMMKEALGDEHYHNAILAYLEECKYATATEETLLRHIQDQIDVHNIEVEGEKLDATALWMPFLRQPLYPLYEVTVNSNTLTVKQTERPFLHNPNAELAENEFEWKYPMIIRYTTYGAASPETHVKLLKSGESKTISIGDEIVKFNTGQTGFYRTKYDDAMRRKLSNALKSDMTQFADLDRVGLMDDAFHLAISGDYTYCQTLDMVDYISNIDQPEDSYYAWNLFSSRTSYMRAQMSGTSTGEKFIEHFQPAVADQFAKIGGFTVLPTDSHVQKKKRSTIVSLAVAFKVDAAVDDAKRLFNDWMTSNGNIKPHPDVRGTVYELGVSNGDHTAWEFVYNAYKNELVASEKKTLMRAMASTENVTTIDFMLNELAMDKSIILEQDFFSFISYISYTTMGNRMVFDWARVHWAELVDRFSTGDRNFGRMVPNMVDGYNTEYGLWAASDFFLVTEADAGAGEGPRANALQQIQANIQWVRDYVSVINDWLNGDCINTSVKYL